MSDAGGTCEYVLDPDDPETWGGEEGDECYVDERLLNDDDVWTCPHDAEEGEDLCIFHLPLAEKDGGDVVEAFRDALDDAAGSDDPEVRTRKLQFLGAKFGAFDLSERPPKLSISDTGIAMSHMTVTGALHWSESKFDVAYLRCAGTAFLDDVDFGSAEFRGKTVFRDAEFKKRASFGSTEFKEEIDFWGAEFEGRAIFIDAEFREVHLLTLQSLKGMPSLWR